MAGLDNGFNYLFSDENETKVCNSLPFNPLQDHRLLEELRKSDSGIQFSHTLEEQIRGQIQVGFQLLDLYEDTNGEGFFTCSRSSRLLGDTGSKIEKISSNYAVMTRCKRLCRTV